MLRPKTKVTRFESDRLAAVSRLFSSTVIRELARKGRSPLFARLARQSLLLDALSGNQRVEALFDQAFDLLKRDGYRDEYIYKTALTSKVLLGRHSLSTASMLNEFRVGECKADLVILNGTATVYEVKSERDGLRRLDRQLAAYSRVFGRVYVVAGANHLESVLGCAPREVGVLCLSHRNHISTVREAIDCSDRVLPAAIFDAIRAQEARLIIESHGARIPTVPNTELHATLRRLFVKLKPRDAQEGMVRTLKITRNLLPLSELVNRLPTSLHTAALSVPLRKADHVRLVSAVNTRLRDALEWA